MNIFNNAQTDFSGNKGINVADGTASDDVAAFGQIGAAVSAGTYWQLSGNDLLPKSGTHIIDAGGNKITGGAAGTASDDFIIKSQLDAAGFAIPANQVAFGNSGSNGLSSISTFVFENDRLLISGDGTNIPNIQVGVSGNLADAGALSFIEGTGNWSSAFGFRFHLNGATNRLSLQSREGSSDTPLEILSFDRGTRMVTFSQYTSNDSSPSIDAVGYFSSGSGLFKRTSVSDLADEIESYLTYPTVGLWTDDGDGTISRNSRIDAQRINLGNSSNSYLVSNYSGELLVGDDVGSFYAFTGFGSGATKPVLIGNALHSKLRLNSTKLEFYTANTSRMLIESSGNVGINVIPSDIFHVKGTSRFQASSTTDQFVTKIHTGNNDLKGGFYSSNSGQNITLFLYTNAGGSSIKISPDGENYFINKTTFGSGATASQALDVVLNARFRGAIYDNNNLAGTSGQIPVTTGSGWTWQTNAPTWSNITSRPTLSQSGGNVTGSINLSAGTFTLTGGAAIWSTDTNGITYTSGNIGHGVASQSNMRNYTFWATSSSSPRYGIYTQISNSSTGSVYGTRTVATTTGGGVVFGSDILASTTGANSDLVGIRAQVSGTSAGTTTTGRSFYALTPSLSGGHVITNQYGFYIANQNVSGVNSPYGIYIEEQTAGSSGFKYNIYSEGNNSVNIFKGSSSFGHSSTPTAKVDVRTTSGNCVRADTDDDFTAYGFYHTFDGNSTDYLFATTPYYEVDVDSNKYGGVFIGSDNTRQMNLITYGNIVTQPGLENKFGDADEADVFMRRAAGLFRKGTTTHKKLKITLRVTTTATTTYSIIRIFGVSGAGEPIDAKVLLSFNSTTVTHTVFGNADYDGDISFTDGTTSSRPYLRLDRTSGNWSNASIQVDMIRAHNGNTNIGYLDITTEA